MNIVFWFLLFLCVIIFWCLCAFAFKPIGKFFSKIGEDVVKGLEDPNNEINKTKEERK